MSVFLSVPSLDDLLDFPSYKDAAETFSLKTPVESGGVVFPLPSLFLTDP